MFEKDWGQFVKLNKTLYGLKQSARYWYDLLRNALQEIGFKRSQSDHCLFLRKSKEWVMIYVDDIVIVAPTRSQIDDIKREIKVRFKIKDLGPINHFLGLKIERDRGTRTLTIS